MLMKMKLAEVLTEKDKISRLLPAQTKHQTKQYTINSLVWL